MGNDGKLVVKNAAGTQLYTNTFTNSYNKGVTDGRSGYYTKAQYDANYTSGYNAGVTAADARTNTSSANYQSGYSAGYSATEIYSITVLGGTNTDNYDSVATVYSTNFTKHDRKGACSAQGIKGKIYSTGYSSGYHFKFTALINLTYRIYDSGHDTFSEPKTLSAGTTLNILDRWISDGDVITVIVW